MMEATLKSRRGTGGRPTRADAVRREEHVLDIAGSIFLEQGFDGTAIDAIAAAAGVGKPSLYARYGDKKGLFLAVIRRRLHLWVRPFAELPSSRAGVPDRDRLRAILEAFGRTLLDDCLGQESVSLARVLTSESARFPELAELLHEEGWMRSIRRLAEFLDRVVDFSTSEVDDPELAADLFFGLVLGRLSRQCLLGVPIDPATLGPRVKAAVAIFLGSGFALRN